MNSVLNSGGGNTWFERLVEAREGRVIAFLLLFSALLFFPFLGTRDMTSEDEAQRAVPPREMLETGDWIVPRLNGVEYLKKPPLLYWQIAAVYAVLGVNEWTARLTCAITGLLVVLATYWWSRELASKRVAILAALFTATNYLTVDKARESQLEINVTLFTLLTAWCWWRGLRKLQSGDSDYWKPVLWSTLWLAIAHLYKIPVSLIFLLPAWAGVCLLQRRWTWLLKWPFWFSMVVSLVPIGLWALAAVERIGWDRVYAIWYREAHLHLVEATEINSGPPWYYVGILIAGFLPWCLLYPVLALRRFRQQAADGLSLQFLGSLVLGSIAFWSANTAKEAEYLAPLVPMLCMLLALAWVWVEREMKELPRVYVPLLLVAAGLAQLLLWGELYDEQLALGIAAVSANFVLAGVTVFLRGRVSRALTPYATSHTVLAVFLALQLGWWWIGDTLTNTRRSASRSSKTLVQKALELEKTGRPLHLYNRRDPEVLFYLSHITPYTSEEEELMQIFETEPSALVIARRSHFKDFQEMYPNVQFNEIARGPENSKFALYERVSGGD